MNAMNARDERQIVVQGVTLSEFPDGTRTLAIASKTVQIELAFSPELWEKLADSARWFDKHVTMIHQNGVSDV